MDTATILREYSISPQYGFLIPNPLQTLGEEFAPWLSLARILPELIQKRLVRQEVDKMPLLDAAGLTSKEEKILANCVLSCIGMAYVWQNGQHGASKSIPAQLAIPWVTVAGQLELPPIATYAGMITSNWRLVDPSGPVTVENTKSLFQIGELEPFDYFVRVHLEIESEFVEAIHGIVQARRGVEQRNAEDVLQGLKAISSSVTKVIHAMKKMYVKLDGMKFYNGLRPYLIGWGDKDSPLPDGLLYEGVSEVPKKNIGGSAAQMITPQCIDAILGVSSGGGKSFLLTMFPKHKTFIEYLENGPSLRKYVVESDNTLLIQAYNEAVQSQTDFRAEHVILVTRYVIIPSKAGRVQNDDTYLAEPGTGGSGLILFLKGIRDATAAAKIPQ